MPIIGSEPIQKNYFRLTITMGGGIVDNVLITPDGLYSVYFIKDGRYFNATGRIPKVVMDYRNPRASYILFDYSADRSACRERIFFPQVQLIKDVTPNSAYKIAIEHGFEGTVEDWLASLHGDPGKSAYDIAVECGFVGTKEEWLESLKGKDGKSAYEVAVDKGYTGTEEEWLASLKGEAGANAYEMAVAHGYTGTEEEWMASMGDVTPVYERVINIENKLYWIEGMEPPASTMLKSSMKDPDTVKANMTKITRVTRA